VLHSQDGDIFKEHTETQTNKVETARVKLGSTRYEYRPNLEKLQEETEKLKADVRKTAGELKPESTLTFESEISERSCRQRVCLQALPRATGLPQSPKADQGVDQVVRGQSERSEVASTRKWMLLVAGCIVVFTVLVVIKRLLNSTSVISTTPTLQPTAFASVLSSLQYLIGTVLAALTRLFSCRGDTTDMYTKCSQDLRQCKRETHAINSLLSTCTSLDNIKTAQVVTCRKRFLTLENQDAALKTDLQNCKNLGRCTNSLTVNVLQDAAQPVTPVCKAWYCPLFGRDIGKGNGDSQGQGKNTLQPVSNKTAGARSERFKSSKKNPRVIARFM